MNQESERERITQDQLPPPYSLALEDHNLLKDKDFITSMRIINQFTSKPKAPKESSKQN
jgi:hypothetical protein